MTLKKYFKKFAALGLAVSMLASVTACSGNSDKTTPEVELEEDVNVNLWYSDDRYTGYFEECARRYHESNAHVTVMLNLVEDENYLDDVYNSCIKSDDGADIFMMSSDDVQKAYLMGLMSANTLYPETFNEDVYGRAAIAASTYSGRLLGYPLTFETSVMVYNKKFATPFKTFEEITGFSDNFQHTDENEAVTQIIGWDVSDVSLNYAFLGEYMNVGGDNADDVTKTYLQDDNIKAAAQAYLQFKDSYGIVRDNPKYSDYIRKFTEGSLLYTIVNTSDLSSIAASGIDYGIMQIPDYILHLRQEQCLRHICLRLRHMRLIQELRQVLPGCLHTIMQMSLSACHLCRRQEVTYLTTLNSIMHCIPCMLVQLLRQDTWKQATIISSLR